MNKLPDKLLKLRKHYSYSQNYVAEYLGIETLIYMGYENGRSIPDFKELKLLAKLYKIPVDVLFINEKMVSLNQDDKYDIDKKNYSYLTNQTRKDTFKKLFIKHKKQALYGVLALVSLLCVLMLVGKDDKAVLSQIPSNLNILDASDTTVVFVRNDKFVGRGDNSNGQIEIESENIFKVAEGNTFTVILKKDGTLDSAGLLTKYAKEISEWENIVDIAVGNGHIVALNHSGKVLCTGDKKLGQCEFDGAEEIKKVFAAKNGTFVLREDGKLEVSGDFVGKSQMKNIENISDISISDNILAYVNENGRITYHAVSGNFNEAPLWRNIVDVAVGNDFIAALDSDGYVHIDIANYKITDEVETWTNIKAIASGKDYLVAYDGDDIVGIGNNAYGQFEILLSQKMELPSVSNIKILVDDHDVKITFDDIPNAIEYRLEIDTGIGYAVTSETNNFVVPIDKFEDGHEYTIKLVAVGDERHENSVPTIITYKFEAAEDENESEDIKTPEQIEIPFTLDLLTGKSKTSFEAYLKGFGVSDEKLHPNETDNICSGSEAVIEGVTGISDYQSLTKSELLEKDIYYYYCKVEVNQDEDMAN